MTKLDIQIRWMIRRDMPEVLSIGKASFEFPWTEDYFLMCLRTRNCIGVAAEHRDTIAGYMVYELHRRRFHVLNFAVHPHYRRRGVGTQMMCKLIDKLSQTRRTEIHLEVREREVGAQLFYRSLGFRCIWIDRGYFVEHDCEDAYLMRYRLGGEDTSSPFHPINRITEYIS